MSEITQEIVVNEIVSNITVETNNFTITPNALSFNIYSAGASFAGGANSTVQFNAGGLLAGSANFTYEASNTTVLMTNSTINNLSVLNIANLGNIANVKINGGLNGYFIQTDGNGNLQFATGGLGPSGTNNSIQFNDNTVWNGSANFTFNSSTNNVNLTGNFVVNGNITSNYYNGNGYNLVNVNASNILGIVSNANFSATAGNINAATYAIENISLISSPAGTYNFDVLSNVIKYTTANANSNITLNFRGNSTTTLNSILGNGQSLTTTYVLTTGNTAYNVSNIQIDGANYTIKYAAGASPLVVANSKNSYTFTIIKTSTTPSYDVLGSFTRYS